MKKYALAILTFLLIFHVFAEKKAVLPELTKPSSITVDKERIYIVDEPAILIYSLNDFKLIKKFGQRGEGPSEFKILPGFNLLRINLLPDSIAVNSMNKISYFTKTGEFLRETKTPFRSPKLHPLGKRFVGTRVISENKKSIFAVNIYDEHFNKVKEIFRQDNFVQPGASANPLLTRPASVHICRNRIFVDGADGIVHCFDDKGEKLFSIKNTYEKRKVLESDKTEVQQVYKIDPRTRAFYETLKTQFRFPEFFPFIRSYVVVDKKIYVLPYKFKQGKGVLYIYDLNGKPLKKSLVSIAEKNILELFPFTIKDGKLFQIIDNEETEEWDLHISDI